MEKLFKINLPPGVFRNGTKYQASGRWYDSNLVRWRDGALEPIGGWVLQTDNNGAQIQTTGKPRTSHSWRKNDSSAWLAAGTPTKLYAWSVATLTLTDITPAGLSTGATDGALSGGGVGYGLGAYGTTPYGGAGGSVVIDADTWTLDNFGEILLGCLTADGKIYESTPTTQATQVTNSPTSCRAVCVTPERFVFAIGASGDPRSVAWCSQNARTVWTPAATNSAGSYPISTNGRLMAGRRTARETLLWTDADMWGATYVGGLVIYRFDQRGSNCGLIGPNACTIADDAAYWMGDGQFFAYTGAVRALPCDVSDYVFGDLNRTQKAKITCVPSPQFGEVTWYYPSASQSGLENDRYVTLNYQGSFWMLGKIARSSGVGPGVFSTPMLWDNMGLLYAHETGNDKGGLVPYIESGPFEIGDGDQVARVQTLIPDELALGDVTVQFFASYHPTEPETVYGPYQVSAKTDVRFTARQVRFRLTENNIITGVTADSTKIKTDASITADSFPGGGVGWRVGDFRVGYIPAGYR